MYINSFVGKGRGLTLLYIKKNKYNINFIEYKLQIINHIKLYKFSLQMHILSVLFVKSILFFLNVASYFREGKIKTMSFHELILKNIYNTCMNLFKATSDLWIKIHASKNVITNISLLAAFTTSNNYLRTCTNLHNYWKIFCRNSHTLHSIYIF